MHRRLRWRRSNRGVSDGPVSSIRPSKDLITVENASLKKIVLAAYGIPDDRDYALVGPNWLATEHFDIQARFPADTQQPQIRLMMQALLASSEFKLTLHRETRQLPTYASFSAKDGPKINAVENGQPRTVSGPGRLRGDKDPNAETRRSSGTSHGEPVTDATGLAGVFDFTLEWSPIQPGDTVADGANGPSIFLALQEQLGLKLESREGAG